MTMLDFVQFLIQYGFLLLSASIHESSHAWTAYKFGDPTAKMQNRISLNPANHIDIVGTVIIPFMVFLAHVPIIGWARPTPVNPNNFDHPRKDSMFVSGAGPVSNIITVGVLTLLWHAAWMFTNRDNFINEGETVPLLFCYVFQMGILVNLMLAVFNMLPIHPLDGSGVLEGLLPEQWAAAYAKMRPYGFIILLVFFYLPPFQQFIGTIVGSLFHLLAIKTVPLDKIW
jgi:Zn-dependent protease